MKKALLALIVAPLFAVSATYAVDDDFTDDVYEEDDELESEGYKKVSSVKI